MDITNCYICGKKLLKSPTIVKPKEKRNLIL